MIAVLMTLTSLPLSVLVPPATWIAPTPAAAASDGALDTTFGTNGITTIDLNATSSDTVYEVAVQSDGKLLVAGMSDLNRNWGLARLCADGLLDDGSNCGAGGFGTGGKVVTNQLFGTNNVSQLFTVVPMSDGSIVAAGAMASQTGTTRNGQADWVVGRYQSSGSLDTSFDTDGLKMINVSSASGASTFIGKLIRLSDGSFLAAGNTNIAGNSASNIDFAIAKFNSDFSFDTSFGTNGLVRYGGAAAGDYFRDVEVLSDGSFIVAGVESAVDFYVARFTASGVLDTTFGTVSGAARTGSRTIDFNGGSDLLWDMEVQSDGKIVVAGQAFIGTGNSDFAVVRLTADGDLDTAFDGDGKATIAMTAAGDLGRAVAVQTDGKIIVAGAAANSGVGGSGLGVGLARLCANGALDNGANCGGNGFGTGGKLTMAMGNGATSVFDIEIVDDTHFVVAGNTNIGSGSVNPAFMVARFLTSSTVSPTKLAITDISPASPTQGQSFSVTVQAQDADGTARNVTASTAISLSKKSGRGVLGGSTTGTIPAGSNEVTITGVTYSVAESGVALTATRTSGDTLTAGDSAAFTVQAAPEPAVSVTPSSKDFGTVMVNTVSDAQTFTVTNTGTADLAIEAGGITLTGANADQFDVTSDQASGQTIAPGGSATVEVVFQPASAGTKTAELIIASNAADSPTNVALTGTAAAPPELSNLVLSHGTLTPAFAAGALNYTASVSTATESITVTPTASPGDSSIEVKINAGAFAPVTSGNASDALALDPGPNTIVVQVTASAGGASTTYTVTVVRAPAGFVVNNAADAVDAALGDGLYATAASVCTLRAAVQEANTLEGPQTITFEATLDGTPITLTQTGTGEDAAATGDLDIAGELTITGNGSESTIIQACDSSLSACVGLDRIFHLHGGIVLIEGVTLRNGDENSTGGGGAIHSDGATLTLRESVLSNNTATDAGGALLASAGSVTMQEVTLNANTAQQGAAVAATNGTVTITGSVVQGNTATGSGGGLLLDGADAAIATTAISGNAAANGGGLAATGTTTLALSGTTLSANTAGTDGGGLHFGGSTLTAVNSTLSGNTAGQHGGGLLAGAGTVKLAHVTVHNNGAATAGGGVAVTGGAVSIKNSIVAGSAAGGSCTGTLTSLGHNLSSDTSCGFSEPTDQQGADPLLRPLADGNGPTLTHIAHEGSPIYNRIPVVACTDANDDPLTVDQRGFARPEGAACDIGAAETSSIAYQAVIATAGFPTTWEVTETKQVSVTVENNGNETWRATGPAPVVLYVQFYGASLSQFLGAQEFQLTGDVPPNGTVTFANLAINAPSDPAAAQVELKMYRRTVSLIPSAQLLPVTVNPPQGIITTTAVPAVWLPSKSQTFTVGMQNTGTISWPATGARRVLLRTGFTGAADRFFALPGDVAPGDSATVSVTLAATSSVQPTDIEFALLKQGANVVFGATTAPVEIRAAVAGTIGVDNVPTVWAHNSTRTFGVQVTNTGGKGWTNSGGGRILLRTRMGVSGPYQYLDLPAAVAPDASQTVNVTLKAPTSGDASTIELALLVGGTTTPFQTASVGLTLGVVRQGAIATDGVPAEFTAGKPRPFTVTVQNTVPEGGATWQTSGPGRVVLRARFGALPYQYVDLAGPVAPGGSGSATVTLTPGTALGPETVDLALLATGTETPFATATANATVVSALRGAIGTDGVPAAWTPNRAQTFTVTVNNTALADGHTWASAGAGHVLLRGKIGGMPVQFFELPGTVAPGSSATVSVTLTPSGAVGDAPVELALVVNGQTDPFASVETAAAVGSPLQGSITTTGIPDAWTAGRSPAGASVLISNTAPPGGTVWDTTGVARVVVRAKTGDLPYQYTELPSSVAPGGSVTVALAGLSGAPAAEDITVEIALLVAGQSEPFAVATKAVTVIEPRAGTISTATTPAALTAGKTRSVTVEVTNTAAPDGDTWQTSGAGRIVLRVRANDSAPWQYVDLPSAVAPGASVTVSLPLTAPATPAADQTMQFELLFGGTTAPFATATTTVDIVPALSGNVITDEVTPASGVPAVWVRSHQQTFTVKLENTALVDGQGWQAVGSGRVLVRARFGGDAPEPYVYAPIGGDVAPGDTTIASITLTAPASTGTYPLELALLVNGVATPFATASASVAVRNVLEASIDSAGVPTAWAGGETKSFTVTATNTGVEAWNATGANPVVLTARFVNAASGTPATPQVTVALLSDTSASAIGAFGVTLTAPADVTGLALDLQLVKQGVTQIPTSLRTPVTVAP